MRLKAKIAIDWRIPTGSGTNDVYSKQLVSPGKLKRVSISLAGLTDLHSAKVAAYFQHSKGQAKDSLNLIEPQFLGGTSKHHVNSNSLDINVTGDEFIVWEVKLMNSATVTATMRALIDK